MLMFLLALLLDCALVIFLLSAIWTMHGWLGVIIFAFGSALVHVLYLFARVELTRRRAIARERRP